jgi:hypothetical protein
MEDSSDSEDDLYEHFPAVLVSFINMATSDIACQSGAINACLSSCISELASHSVYTLPVSGLSNCLPLNAVTSMLDGTNGPTEHIYNHPAPTDAGSPYAWKCCNCGDAMNSTLFDAYCTNTYCGHQKCKDCTPIPIKK